MIASLNSEAGALPTEYNSGKWTSYGYWRSNKTTPDYMWYIDLSLGDNQYRGVYFTNYRPATTADKTGTAQYYNGYQPSTVYWFRYDPIKWRILTETNGKALRFQCFL